MKMLQFLHSFDDAPEVQEETEMPPGAWWEARETTLEEDGLTDIEREQLELLRSIGYLPGYERLRWKRESPSMIHQGPSRVTTY